MGLKLAAQIFTGVAAIVIAIAALVLTDIAQWQEITGFFDWLSRATAFGAAFAGIAALFAARLAYRGVQESVRSAEKREKSNRKMADNRERETARHERFTIIVSQLATTEATTRLGGLLALSALADEWEREARRLIQKSSFANTWSDRQNAWQNSMKNLMEKRQKLDHAISFNAMPPDEEFSRWNRQLAQAEQAAFEAREQYVLTRHTAPLAAKDAVAQRDACLELVTAYLRGTTPGRPPTVTTELGVSAKQPWHPPPESTNNLSVADDNLPKDDDIARAAAVNIIRDHTIINASYPWPSQKINLESAHLEHARLSGLHLEGANLKNAHLEHANMESAHLEYSSLDGAQLKNANLTTAHLNEAGLWGAHLEHAQMNGAHLELANMWGAHLNYAYLCGTHLEDANLYKAHLNHATLTNAHLNQTNLKSAILEGAHMEDVRLIGTCLDGAHIKGACLDQIHLVGVTEMEPGDFTDYCAGAGGRTIVRMLVDSPKRKKAIVCAIWDTETQWPDDFDPESLMARQVEDFEKILADKMPT